MAAQITAMRFLHLQHALGKAVGDEQLQDGRQDQQQNDPEDRLIKVADHTAPFECRRQAHEIRPDIDDGHDDRCRGSAASRMNRMTRRMMWMPF